MNKIGFLGLCGSSVFMDVEHFHRPGETLHAKSTFTEPGGKGYNQAVAAQRLGAKTLFVGCVGNDDAARACKDFLINEGAEPVMQVTERVETACAFILTDSRGENQVTVCRGASDYLTADFVRDHESEILSCGMLILNLECPMDATLTAAEIAFENDIPVILNPAPARAVDVEFLKKCECITPNRSEAAELFGIDSNATLEDLAKAITTNGIKSAVITLGGDGALLVKEGEAWVFGAIPVKAVDTTGAGDTFSAALGRAILRGNGMTKAVEYAMNAAALSVTRRHVMDGLPTEDELYRSYVEIVPEKIL